MTPVMLALLGGYVIGSSVTLVAVRWTRHFAGR